MSKEEQAAQVDPLDAFVQEAIDQGNEPEQTETPQVESAPTPEVKAEETPEPQADETPKEDGFQKRINKVTADKYAEKRRADELQAKLDALNTQAEQPPAKAPTLEEHDYDDAAFNQANVAYQVQQEIAKANEVQRQALEQQKYQQTAAEFDQRIAALGKEDFNDKANAIPQLPQGVAEALMQSDNGAELIYHLGSHLDQADALASMTPAAAMMELGRISTTMSKKPEPKLSAAPDPVEPLKAGSALPTEIGDDMSIDAWMAKYN